MPRLDRNLRTYLGSFLSDHRRELLPRLLRQRTRFLTVVVEDIYQSHNASACVRSCDCFGVQDIHIIENNTKYEVNDKVALGSAQWLTTHCYNDTATCLQSLRDRGYQIVMTSPHEPTCELETYQLTKPAALVFGNEKLGASDTVRQMADDVLRIPMYGFTESFNISVAVAVCLHHLVWKMREAGHSWELEFEEREALLDDWVQAASEGRMDPLRRRYEELVAAGTPPTLDDWPNWDSVIATPPIERANRRAAT